MFSEIHSFLFLNSKSLQHLGVTVLLVCLGWPPDVFVCWAHGLLFVVCAMCSSVYCLSPPILLPHHCSSGSTSVPLVTLVCLPIYPPGVWNNVLIRCLSWCMCYVDCYSSLPACLPVFPLLGIFVHFCFILWLKKKPFSCTCVLAFISLLTHPDRMDKPDEDSAESATSNHGSRAEASQHPPGRQEHWGIRQGLLGSGSLVGYGKSLPHGLFLGRPSQALQVPYALLAPRGVTGGVNKPGSEFKRLSLQGGVRARSVPWAQRVCSRARSLLWADRVRSRARSVPWADGVRSRARFVPWTHGVRSRARFILWAHRVCSRDRSVPWADRVRSRARSVPWGHGVRSRARSVPFAHRVRSRTHSVPWAHRVRSRALSVPWAHRVRSRARSVPWGHRAHSFCEPTGPARSVSPQGPLRSGSPQGPLRSGSPQGPLHSGSPQSPLQSPFCSGSPSGPLRSGIPQSPPNGLLHCQPRPALASCSACPTLAPLSAYSSRPSSTPWSWPTVPSPDPPPSHPPPRHFFFVCVWSVWDSLLKGGVVSRSCWCARAGHQMSLCVEHMACCLLLVSCARLSIACPFPSCYLIIISVAPPVSPSLLSFVSLFILLVSSFIVCVLCWLLQFSACLFFSFGVVFVNFCFILWLKRNHSLALESSPHLSPHAQKSAQEDWHFDSN